MAKICVRTSRRSSVVSDVNIITSSECWSITGIRAYSVLTFIHIGPERREVVSVDEGKYERIRTSSVTRRT